MRNIFFLYIPPTNYEALIHYQDTIINKISPDRIYNYVDANLKLRLKSIFGNKPIAVWGSRDSKANRSRFERMMPGDDILIVEGDTIKLLGKIAAKTINHELSRELWKNINNVERDEGWDLIYFIANPLEIDLPFQRVKELFSYADNYTLRGFSNISEGKLRTFYDQYDDLYSILQRIKLGQSISKKEHIPEQQDSGLEMQEDIPAPESSSEHLTMQWKLVQLGMKTGSKVWVPKSDQPKIISKFDFGDFEREFSAGIDTQAKYVENIDVVWKDEFRIDAAFEIENTTSVYSGLLRFSDLKIIAPNSNYPLFIVAPQTRRNRVIEQVKRPTFKKLNFSDKVKFLPYETVNEIDNFFRNSSSGLNVDLLVGKSESIG